MTYGHTKLLRISSLLQVQLMQSGLLMHGRSGGYIGLDPAANNFHRIGKFFDFCVENYKRKYSDFKLFFLQKFLFKTKYFQGML